METKAALEIIKNFNTRASKFHRESNFFFLRAKDLRGYISFGPYVISSIIYVLMFLRFRLLKMPNIFNELVVWVFLTSHFIKSMKMWSSHRHLPIFLSNVKYMYSVAEKGILDIYSIANGLHYSKQRHRKTFSHVDSWEESGRERLPGYSTVQYLRHENLLPKFWGRVAGRHIACSRLTYHLPSPVMLTCIAHSISVSSFSSSYSSSTFSSSSSCCAAGTIRPDSGTAPPWGR